MKNPFEPVKGIRLEVDGEWYAPADLAWVEWAPCGCMSAVATLWGDTFTAEAAWAKFHEDESAEYTEWERGLGFRVELLTFEHYKSLPFGECPHTPKWGKPIPPTPFGRQWRVKGGERSSKKARWHLFDLKEEGVRYTRDPLVSACGKQLDYWEFQPDGFTPHLHCAACSEVAFNTGPVKDEEPAIQEHQETALDLEIA